MAKAKVATQATTPATTPAADLEVKKAKTPAAKPTKQKTIESLVYAKDPLEGAKYAPQCQIILGHLKAAGAEGLTRKALVAALEADPAFTTRQPIERIIAYYLPDLKNSGVVKIVATEVAAEVPAKPAVVEDGAQAAEGATDEEATDEEASEEAPL